MKGSEVLAKYNKESIKKVIADRDVKTAQIAKLREEIAHQNMLIMTVEFGYGIGAVVSKIIRSKECHIQIVEHDGTNFKAEVIKPENFLKGKRYIVYNDPNTEKVISK